MRETIDLGLHKDCKCKTNEHKPGVVLDPFGGAGTTGLVADRLGRDAVLIELNKDYEASITSKEPRLVFPFYDENKNLTGVTCRGIRGEALRYITIKLNDDKPLIYGLESIDNKKIVNVVEGPIDSLFLDNSIAVAGTSLHKLSSMVYDNIVIIYDNQPRNKQVCDQIEKAIDNQQTVVIWPQNITEKDINDMVSSKLDVKKIIKENTFKGLHAKMKFVGWKRI